MDELNKKLDKLTEHMDTQFASIAQEFGNIRQEMATKDDLDKLVTKEEFRKGYDKLDLVLGELQTVRQEQVMHTGSHQRVDETLAEYDKRIKKLESPTAAAHTIRQ